jgi:hypothetical protein
MEGVGLFHPLALEIMSQLQCYNAFVKVTNDIGMQNKWIADEDWVQHIALSPENKRQLFRTRRGLLQ